ncbi:MAG: thermonuclease family protein [Dehalococcoidia bacterium]
MSQRRRYEPGWPDYGPRRTRQLRLLVGLLALILVSVAGSRFLPGAGSKSATPVATSNTARASSGPLGITEGARGWVASTPLETRPDATKVRVERVIDGDTIDVDAAQTHLRIRFYGVDTPERDERCYAEATARTTALVGSTVVLVPDARLQDPNGRELRYVFTSEGRSVDATLVAEGLARAWRGDGTLAGRLTAIEERAKRDHVGCLWTA